MLQLDKIEAAPVSADPFPHIVAGEVLPADQEAALGEDFPRLDKTGFFPLDAVEYGPVFRAVLDDVRGDDFARAVGAKLGIDLAGLPRLVTCRKWSAAKDGRVHTDGADKVASALIYFNPRWGHAEGRLRFLAGPDLDGPGTPEIDPGFGSFVAFPRRDDSWHGHKPFAGERRVLQIAWLVDAAAMDRKARRHATTGFFKKLWPGGRV